MYNAHGALSDLHITLIKPCILRKIYPGEKFNVTKYRYTRSRARELIFAYIFHRIFPPYIPSFRVPINKEITLYAKANYSQITRLYRERLYIDFEITAALALYLSLARITAISISRESFTGNN